MCTWISVHTCVEGRKEKREGCAREIVVLGVRRYDAAQNGAGRRIFLCQHRRDVHGHTGGSLTSRTAIGTFARVRKGTSRSSTTRTTTSNCPIGLVVE